MGSKKHIVRFLAILVLLTAVCAAAYRLLFPFGPRPCYLPMVMQALVMYAEDNNGYFPTGGRNAREALLKLYPDYITYEFLAGLSGDKKLLRKQMLAGVEITEDASSWVYWPGFRNDDPADLAIIWERSPGVNAISGRAPSGSHAVGFVNGRFAQVSGKKWFEFLKEQELLRRKIREARVPE